MLLNDRSLANQRHGLNNSFNQDFYVWWAKNEDNNSVLFGRSSSKRAGSSRTRFDFPSLLSPVTQAMLRHKVRIGRASHRNLRLPGGRKNEENNSVLAAHPSSKRAHPVDPSALVLSSLPFYGLPRWLRSGTKFVFYKIVNMLRIGAVKNHKVEARSQQF